MRIIAGSRKGIPLKSLPGNETRPTSDKVKESIFNRIGPYFDGGIVVELFGGSGALSLEALSRGADKAIVFEKNSKACSIIKANAEKTKFTDQVHIERADARKAVSLLKKHVVKIDYLFIDPPYAEKEFYELAGTLVEAGLLSDNAVIVCEHDKKLELPDSFDSFTRVNCSNYGNSAVSIYKK
ncbi:16S rRNA (guanine(966)-N(2))-methyltransferase RsmD [Sporosarcina sp. FA9]|uniref:16S rRNA (guanine(966)-N(2))-methyltransferase RsmD n=1 Tax=Sporosarcina sp. FA9 TaxID=3413030 RepID=UPI003F65C723